MYRPALRYTSTVSLSRIAPKTRAARRFVSTAPPHQKSRSWRSSAARWGLAGALVYYYNTATAFAEEPAYSIHAPPETGRESETYATLASISEQRRAQARAQPLKEVPETRATAVTVSDAERPAPGSPEALEEEAGEQGAFNEETGEINWDCPCLGGMAYGPCGEQFRAAFSCFVFSKEEPKGVDCIKHFKAMQNCFREHPDVYGAELDDDEDSAPVEGIEEGQATPISSEPSPVPAPAPASQVARVETHPHEKQTAELPPQQEAALKESRQRVTAAGDQVKRDHGATSEDPDLMPKAWHDGREAGPASQSS